MTNDEIASYVFWRRSFVTGIICFRYLLTPLATITRVYNPPDNCFSYLDVYVFGVRLARIHRT